MPNQQRRRTFLKKTGLVTGAALLGGRAFSIATGKRHYTAAVIGRTGRGDYGHGLDTIFNELDNVEVLAIADENQEGLERAAGRSQAKRMYLDYREMLDKEKPNLVSIAPRQPDCHKSMALAAIGIGAHIYMEKPLTESPDEADDIVTAAERKGVKISVAHTRRFKDHFLLMRKIIRDGCLGDILHVQFQGKQDSRVGGEDLIVLGVHDMDIMRFLFGDPRWCLASATVKGRDITKADIHSGREPYAVAGDTIRAQYAFDNNIACNWRSIARSPEWNRNYEHKGKTINKWGFEIHGTDRILSHQESIGTLVLDFPFTAPGDPDLTWKRLDTLDELDKPDHLQHPIRDLIYAIENDTEPLCSGRDARWAVEMVCAVYRSQLSKGRVEFPLKERGHPLRRL